MTTKRIRQYLLPGLLVLVSPVTSMAAEPPDAGTWISTPVVIESPGGETQAAERGLFFVPENRAAGDGRLIAIHFLRFPAREPVRGRSPVFLLAGGPGSEYDFTEQGTFRRAQRLRQTRDVVYVSQRGNPVTPTLVPPLYFEESEEPLSEPGSAALDRERLRASVREGQETWIGRGVDLEGYDILNIVDDVYELRAALGYEKIALRACSFGSQWSFAYMKRWPRTVERALLSGIEPLDYAYDSPKWLWAAMSRLAEAAEADPHLAPYIPDGGLMKTLQTVVRRLEERPVTVGIETPAGDEVEVVLGVHDLRRALRASFGDSRRERYQNWPRYLLELHRGDYRYLAAMAWGNRSHAGRDRMIGLLIDNSLGITERRDTRLLDEREARWLGDINWAYRASRDLTVTPTVGDDFRADFRIGVPVLLVNGDVDWSTPYENAEHLLGFLEQGHLIRVRGAGHCPVGAELEDLRPEVAEQIRTFLEADFSETSADAFFDTLPDDVSLPAFDFARPVGPSLYEQWLAEERG